jgi:hypothetical protein
MSSTANPRTLVWPAIRRVIKLSGRNWVWLYLAMGMAVLEATGAILWNLILSAHL